MGTDLTPLTFSNGEFDLTFHPNGSGGWWIPAAPVAVALGFREAYDLTRTIPDDEKGSEIVRTPGGDQRVLCLTLAGFFRALGQRQASRIKDPAVRAQVERYQAWNFGTVLPSIATTGSYSLPVVVPQPAIPQTFADALQLAADQARMIDRQKAEIEAVEAKVAEMAPRAEAWDEMVKAGGDLSLRAACKVLRSSGVDIRPVQFNLWLHEKRVIYRAGEVGDWLPYEDPAPARRGWVTTRLVATKSGRTKEQTRVTVAPGMEQIRPILLAGRGSTRKQPSGQTSMELVIR